MTIKELRALKKLTQSAFAKSIGVGLSTVGNYEAGRIQPSDAVAAKIKEVYGVEVTAEPKAAAAAPKKEKKEAAKPAEKKAAAPKKEKKEAAKPAEKKAAAPKQEKKADPAAEKKAEKPAEKKPVEKKAAKPAEKKPAEKKAAEKKPAEKKTAEKKPAAKRPPKKAAPAQLIIQSPYGGEITPFAILAKVGQVDKIYIRVDLNKAFWVKGTETGSVDLW